MASIFNSDGAWSMGFDMNPAGANVFTQMLGGGGTAISTTTPYSFGLSLQIGNSSGILLGTNLTTLIVGYAYMPAAIVSSGTGIVATFHDATAGAAQVTLRESSTGTLQFYLGSGTGTPLGPATAAGTISPFVWSYIEMVVTISATVGYVQLNVNGTNLILASGLNTKSTANTFVNAFQFTQPGAFNCFVDDWYMLDSTAPAPNNAPLGPVQCRGNGATTNSGVSGRNAWTPISGTNHGNVATTPAVPGTYNFDSTPGDYDMFGFGALPSTAATVFFVTEWANVLLDSAGARTVSLDASTVVSGASTHDTLSTAFTPSASSLLYNRSLTVDPSGAAWTPTSAGAIELGVKVVS